MLDRIPRSGQMYAVLALAFGIQLVFSVLVLAGVYSIGVATAWHFFWNAVYEVLCLAVLYLVLLNQKRSLAAIGFSLHASVSDVWHSIVLFFAAFLSSTVVYALIVIFYQFITGHPFRQWDGAAVFGKARGIMPLLFVFLNPFFEELLVRAYLMTEIEEQLGRAGLAIVASVGLQVAYHLYQGLVNACALAAVFTCFAVYFSRTRRILPVILAHMYADVLALMVSVRS